MSRVRVLAALVFVGLILAGLARPHAAQAQFRGQKPEIIRLNERVYCATGYALGNVIFIVTDDSLVVVDTTESPLVAGEVLGAFRKISRLPISHVIYTHFHGDHVNGSRIFKEKKTKIIAQKLLLTEGDKYALVRFYNRRVNAAQFGTELKPDEREVELALDPRFPIIGYVEPDITFDDEYVFEQGGVRIELYHAPGETHDHLFVWLPQSETLMPGDLFYNSFPMLASPLKPDRPVDLWAKSIERMRALGPAYLAPSHLAPLSGRDQINAMLGNYARAIRIVHDKTIAGLEDGLPLEEIRRQVKLPPELAELPYLAQLYGRIPWAVNGIYRQYTGWYDFNPAHLNPGPTDELHKAILEAAGGASPLLERARLALEGDQTQLALELTDIILGAEPKHREAHALRAAALTELADDSQNAVERNIYKSAAAEHQSQAD